MKPEQIILVQLVDENGKQVQMGSVYVHLYLYTLGDFRYCFDFGPTDTLGNLRITFEEVEGKRIEAGKTSLMDYNTPLGECDNRVCIKVPSKKNLQDAYEAATSWNQGIPPEFAKPWLTANNMKIKASETFVELREKETIVPIKCEMMG